jgi:ATP-binding protein involved in chromosome partitioning
VRTIADLFAKFLESAMSEVSPDRVEAVLAGLTVPYLEKDWVNARAVKQIDIQDNRVFIELELGFPCSGKRNEIIAEVNKAVGELDGVNEVNTQLGWHIAASDRPQQLPGLEGVKNVVVVGSGKGGVGKSTTSVNLAIALAKQGASVGLLDADIYGPSQQLMLGIPESQRPRQEGELFLPIETHGLKTMCIGFLIEEKTAMVWRGPMASTALQQLLSQTKWGELDYLVVDMPPGTGDIQLTLSQRVPVAGAVIITTPQDIALLDAQKGIEMFNKVNVPILGIVENMAVHVCSNCGHQEHLFGEGGGERIASEYGVELLGSLPLDRQIREQVDGGNPTVAADPESPISATYSDIACRVAARLSQEAGAVKLVTPTISIVED